MNSRPTVLCPEQRAEGIQGIVDVHCLFQGPESGVMGMLKTDADISLRRRGSGRIGKYAEQVMFTWRERRVLEQIFIWPLSDFQAIGKLLYALSRAFMQQRSYIVILDLTI